MLVEYQLSVEYEAKVLSWIIGPYDGSSQQSKIERRRIKNFLESIKIKKFSFRVFYYKTKLFKQLG